MRVKHQAKQLLRTIAQHLPVSSKYIGLPKGVYASAKEYANLCGAVQAGVDYKIFLPESVSRRIPPGTIGEKQHWKFDGRLSHTNPETFLICIPGGRTAGGTGAVITHDDRLLLDVSRDFTAGTHHLFKNITLPRCRKLSGKAAVLAVAGGNAYFHWLADSLPRIEILRKTLPGGLAAVDHFIVNRGIPVIAESLTMLGIPAGKIVFADDLHIQAENLIVPSLPGISGDPPPWACSFLRESFISHKADISPQPRLYISRSNARYRQVENEAEVIECLSRQGFSVIRLEEHSFAEQIALFAGAEVIVAPHGAGLTNLLWCKAGTKVLELFSPNYVNVCYWAAANQLGLDYHYLIGGGTRPQEGFDPHRVQDDIRVPIDGLTRSLDVLLK